MTEAEGPRLDQPGGPSAVMQHEHLLRELSECRAELAAFDRARPAGPASQQRAILQPLARPHDVLRARRHDRVGEPELRRRSSGVGATTLIGLERDGDHPRRRPRPGHRRVHRASRTSATRPAPASASPTAPARSAGSRRSRPTSSTNPTSGTSSATCATSPRSTIATHDARRDRGATPVDPRHRAGGHLGDRLPAVARSSPTRAWREILGHRLEALEARLAARLRGSRGTPGRARPTTA